MPKVRNAIAAGGHKIRAAAPHDQQPIAPRRDGRGDDSPDGGCHDDDALIGTHGRHDYGSGEDENG